MLHTLDGNRSVARHRDLAQGLRRQILRAHVMGLVYSEESRLLKQGAVRVHGATVALCWRKGTSGQMHQRVVSVDELHQLTLPVLVDQPDGYNYWMTQNTLRPRSIGRRLSSVMLLNAAWVDVDLLHPGKNWQSKYPNAHPPKGDPEALAALLVEQMIDEGLPEPTYVVWTGGGLCAKWLLSEPLHVSGRARWASVQKHILDRIEGIRWPNAVGGEVRWPIDRGASDAARILRLVGTVNPKWEAPCWICWDRGPEYRFDDLADHVLPYTREQVRAWREQQKQWSEWSSNRVKAGAAGIREAKRMAQPQPGDQLDIELIIADEAARALWTGRFEFAHAVVQARGGAKEGNRNSLLWLMATALSWSCGGSLPELKQEILALHQDLFSGDGWTQDDAMASASTVAKRLSEPVTWSTGKYKFKTSTWLERLEATPAEIQEFGRLLGSGGGLGKRHKDHWRIGSMGFDKLKNLPSDQYIAETKDRQAQAARRSAQVRSTTHAPEKRKAALEMASRGIRQVEIAKTLGVSQQTISRWIR